ncbi:MAG: hypothetical protein K2V38_16440 [Gemmataceae bacterium]|nr:hypothetical protein [Gemmataceae bacterium]
MTETSYETVLPQSRIVVTYTIPRATADYITLELQNASGVTVDSWALDEPDWGDPQNPLPPEAADPDGDWQRLAALFREVHRRVTGWDKVLSDVEKALASPGPIGLPPGQ